MPGSLARLTRGKPHSLYLFLIQAIISLRELFPDHYGHVCNGNLVDLLCSRFFSVWNSPELCHEWTQDIVYIPICMYALFLSKRVTWSIYLRGGIWYYTDEKGEEVLYALIVHRHAQRLNVAASLRLRMDGSDIRERKKWRIVTRCACTIAVIACLRVCVCVCR